MKAIETRWNNYRFRSRLEARWAVFFDTVGIAYHYEPEGYDLAQATCLSDSHDDVWCVCRERAKLQQKDAWYLPDFFLPDVGLRSEKYPGLFFEVKGIANEKDDTRCALLGALTSRPVIMATIAPFTYADNQDGLYQVSPSWDQGMIFERCPVCGYCKIEFAGGGYWNCPKCKADIPLNDHVIMQGVRAARQARF